MSRVCIYVLHSWKLLWNEHKKYIIKVLSLTYANKLQLKENFLTRNKLESVINFMMHEYRPQLATQWANCINLLMSTQLWIFKCSFKFFYESANNLFLFIFTFTFLVLVPLVSLRSSESNKFHCLISFA